MIDIEVNYLAVFVVTLLSMAIGAAWYGPLFGTKWVALMGFDMSTPEKKMAMQKQATPAYIASFVGLFIMAWIMSHILAFRDAQTAMHGVTTGFFLWLGFVAPTMTINALWGNKNINLLLIDVFHVLAYMLLMGVLLTVWK